jgi:pyruvate/2-oxoacid:ferredoxin oxidoreductase beta subunit
MFNIVASHNPAYVATTSIAYPDDFYAKFEKAKNAKGFRFIHLLSACPPGWKINSEDSIKVMRLAVETGVFVLMEKEGENDTFVTYKPEKLLPVREYFKVQGRYKHLDEDTIDTIQQRIDKRLKKLGVI